MQLFRGGTVGGWSWRDTPDFHAEWAKEGNPNCGPWDDDDEKDEDDVDWDFARDLQEDR